MKMLGRRINEYLQNKYLILIFTRCFTRDWQILNKNTKIQANIKAKGKIIAIKRVLNSNKGSSSSVIQWKRASTALKRLNWENKSLFGPIQFSKSKAYDHKKIEEAYKFIQRETVIPIIEPTTDMINAIQKSNFNNQSNEFALSLISSFPLMNKSTFPSSKLNDKINDFNYLRKHLEDLCKNFSVPSVSTILQKTMPKERLEILNLWKQNMINKLGEEGFEKYQKELLADGASLHSSINNYLVTIPEPDFELKEENIGHWKSLKCVFPYIKDVKFLEEKVNHPFLCYRGVVDLLAKYKDQLVIIDWKTSKKSKSDIRNTYDNPLQIAAYIGAVNFDPRFQYLVNKGIIVVAYENGMPATTHFIDENAMIQYWQEWLERLKQFWEMQVTEDKKS